MGGRPLTALSIAAMPENDFPPEWMAAIFRGGANKLKEAGCALLGGHTVKDPEIKFGYAVTGVVDEEAILTNANAKAGDVMVLTKPLGTGIIATAQKAGRASEAAIEASSQSMARLNRIPAEMARRYGAHAATDITGFGLVGHALGIARQSRVGLKINTGTLPLLPDALLLSEKNQSRGLKANQSEYRLQVDVSPEIPQELMSVVYDPQTSGGLLLCLPPERAEAFLLELKDARAIGSVVDSNPGRLRLLA